MALRTEFLCAVINDFGAKELLFSEISFAIPLANRLKTRDNGKGHELFLSMPFNYKTVG